MLWSHALSGPPQGPPLVVCPGYGSTMHDYAPLAELFGERQVVYRVQHHGTARWDAFLNGLRFLWLRRRHGVGAQEAARTIRARIHHPAIRARRLSQLHRSVLEVMRHSGASSVDLAGHSYGTDTVLMFAGAHGRQIPIDTLYLFSPHPPGYLIPPADYARLPVKNVVVVSGTRDRTRDGVGPEQRMKVMECLPASARGLVLDGVGHMDFAFADLGPRDWPAVLREWLDSPALHEQLSPGP